MKELSLNRCTFIKLAHGPIRTIYNPTNPHMDSLSNTVISGWAALINIGHFRGDRRCR